MGDFRIGSLGPVDAFPGQTKDGPKKRPRQGHIEPEEEPTDQVTLSSGGEAEEEADGYLPAASDDGAA
jgi:hypothetical protein